MCQLALRVGTALMGKGASWMLREHEDTYHHVLYTQNHHQLTRLSKPNVPVGQDKSERTWNPLETLYSQAEWSIKEAA